MTGASISQLEPIVLDNDRDLEAAADRWRTAPAVALDTEFVRTRTFFARLGLVQLSTEDQIWLLDPLAVDPQPLLDLLQDDSVVKIFHSCGEDLEVLYRLSEDFPQPLIDTQLAAAFAGYGYSLGYGKLVELFHGVTLPKGETRTDWTRRPLTHAQLRYAAQDVLYLLPIYRRLQSELADLDRLDWLLEDQAGLMDRNRFLPDPEQVYRKLKGGRRLDRRQRTVLQRLATWRETEARRRDLPRNFVVREPVLIDLAQRMPDSQQQLLRTEGLDIGLARRFGSQWLRMIEEVRDLPSSELLPAVAAGTDLRPYKRLVDKMRRAVSDCANELSLPPELLANRRTVESTLRRSLEGKEPVLPKALRGWRQEIIGGRLAELAATA